MIRVTEITKGETPNSIAVTLTVDDFSKWTIFYLKKLLKHEIDSEVLDKLLPEDAQLQLAVADSLLGREKYIAVETKSRDIKLLVRETVLTKKALDLVERVLEKYQVQILSRSEKDITIRLTPATLINLMKETDNTETLAAAVNKLITGIFETKQPKEVLAEIIEDTIIKLINKELKEE